MPRRTSASTARRSSRPSRPPDACASAVEEQSRVSAETTSKRYRRDRLRRFHRRQRLPRPVGGGTPGRGPRRPESLYDPRMKAWRLAVLRRSGALPFPPARYHRSGPVADFFRAGSARAVRRRISPGGPHRRADRRSRILGCTWNTNINGTLHVLDACRVHQGAEARAGVDFERVRRRQPEVPFRENARPARPLSPYAASKKAAEVLAYCYHALYGLDVSVLRYFTVYGPAGRPT